MEEMENYFQKVSLTYLNFSENIFDISAAPLNKKYPEFLKWLFESHMLKHALQLPK